MWNIKEEKYLINNYPNTKNEILAKDLNVSIKKITSKAYRLGLKKNSEHISKMISNRNKIVGRDLNFISLNNIASQYKSRSEFQKKDASAYSVALKMGILDDICKHMTIQSFSIPQMIMQNLLDKVLKSESTYNNRKILKPYEIDVYYEKFKLGFEYNGRGWHLDVERDFLKRKMAEKNDIILITIKENSRKYEKDIKKQLITHLSIINDKTKLSITEEDVNNMVIDDVYSLVYDFNEMFKLASKYSNKKEFREQNRKLYDKLYKLGRLEEATKYFSKPI